MSRSPLFVIVLVGACLALILAACTPAAAPAAPPTVTLAPATATIAPATVTAAPPTATPAPPPTATAEATKPAAAATAYPLALKDDLGREVRIPHRPVRIVSLAPSITEMLFAVGAGPQVVGLTEYCNYPPDAQKGRTIVGGFSAKSLSVEKIVGLNPDLVFAAGAIHEPVSAALAGAAAPVFNIDPKDFEGVYAAILTVGAITGNPVQAESVVRDMRARAGKVSAVAAGIPQDQRVKVYYEVWDEPLMSTGRTTFIGQMIEMAGGVNIFADVQKDFPTVSAEAVIARSPDVILGPSYSSKSLTVEKISARPGWQDLPAVQTRRVVIVDGDLISRSGPRLAEALEIVAVGLYPKQFK